MQIPLLLTPGPLTTAPVVRQAMLRDWGSREKDFAALDAGVRTKLAQIANAGSEHTALLIQGSGTFAVEAMLGTFVPKQGKLLLLVNGSYGRRMATMCDRMERSKQVIEWPEDESVDVARLAAALESDSSITHVAVVHVETTSGLLNPVEEISRVVHAHGRRLLVDAMASFGALPLDLQILKADAVAASSNKCLEGVPGIGVVLCNITALQTAAGNSPCLALDLHDQWRGFETNGQWRFTPPVQIVAALNSALDLLSEEGGIQARLARYRQNAAILLAGMRGLGFTLFLREEVQAPIILTFHPPTHPQYNFDRLHQGLLDRGFAIYPGKLTKAESFRVGCIGQIFPADMNRFIITFKSVMSEMGIH